MQYHLRDMLLLFLTTAIVLRAAIVTRASFVFWVWFVWMALLSTVFVILGSFRRARALVPGIFLGALLLLHLLDENDVPVAVGFVFTYFMATAAVVALVRDVMRWRTLARIALGVMATTWGLALVASQGAVRRIHALRQAHPLVSIADRLAYEKTVDTEQRPIRTALRPNDLVFERLPLDYVAGYSNDRYRSLLEIWSDETLALASFNGLGTAHQHQQLSRSAAVAPLRNIPFSLPLARSQPSSARGWRWALQRPSRLPDLSPWKTLHWLSVVDFLDPAGYGAPNWPRSGISAGFISHAFHRHPLSLVDKNSPLTQYDLLRLELISFWRFDEPRVYVSDHLPRLDQLRNKDVRTRALDAVETEFVKLLAAQRIDMLVRRDATNRTVRVVGAIWIQRECYACHRMLFNQPIGAFSYQLQPRKPAVDKTQSP